MTRRISAYFPLLLISLVCVLMVEGFYRAVENVLFGTTGNPKLVAQVPEKKKTHTTLKRSAEDDVRIVLERSIFGPSPSADSKQPAAEAMLENMQATTLDLVLMGTITGNSDENRAIILEKAKKTQDIYRKGEMVQGAVLKEILRGKVILNFNDKDEILDMIEAAKYSSTPPAAVAHTPRQQQTIPGVNQELGAQISPADRLETDSSAEIQSALPVETQGDQQENAEITAETPPEMEQEQEASEVDQQPPEIPPTEVQPKTIRPARRFTIQLPSQSSE